MKFIVGLRVWVNGRLGKTPQVFPRIRGSANRRVDLHLPLIASISGRLNGAGVRRTVVSGADERRGQETLAERRASRSDRFWLLELGVSRTFLDKLRPQFSGHGYPTQRAANTSVLARGVLSVRTPRFLDISRHFTVHLFSQWIPNSTRCQYFCPHSGRFVSSNSAFSRHF